MVEMCTCAEPDLAELAWAAGFFDGEGSTIAKSDSDRPGYYQLVVTVPQSGRDGVPEVLLRFQRAVLGMGVIDRADAKSVLRWRARGFVDAQATIALLWRSLGGVKRDQAAAAMRTVMQQYRNGTYAHRHPKASAMRKAHEPHSTLRQAPSDIELECAWAAGLFDAEGWIGLKRSHPRKDGSEWRRVRASVSQHGKVGVSAQVLVRFAEAVGVGRIECHGESDDFKWVCERLVQIEAVMVTLRPWLGIEKRAQAEDAVRRFRAQPRVRGTSERCVRGHLYDTHRLKESGRIRKTCNACARLRDRAKRAAKGIPPRQFKNVARRYNS